MNPSSFFSSYDLACALTDPRFAWEFFCPSNLVLEGASYRAPRRFLSCRKKQLRSTHNCHTGTHAHTRAHKVEGRATFFFSFPFGGEGTGKRFQSAFHKTQHHRWVHEHTMLLLVCCIGFFWQAQCILVLFEPLLLKCAPPPSPRLCCAI